MLISWHTLSASCSRAVIISKTLVFKPPLQCPHRCFSAEAYQALAPGVYAGSGGGRDRNYSESPRAHFQAKNKPFLSQQAVLTAYNNCSFPPEKQKYSVVCHDWVTLTPQKKYLKKKQNNTHPGLKPTCNVTSPNLDQNLCLASTSGTENTLGTMRGVSMRCQRWWRGPSGWAPLGGHHPLPPFSPVADWPWLSNPCVKPSAPQTQQRAAALLWHTDVASTSCTVTLVGSRRLQSELVCIFNVSGTHPGFMSMLRNFS